MMSRSFNCLLALVAFPLAVLTSGAANADPLRVVTSIETFADLARSVGGKNVQVESLARGYQDPHFVEAKPSLLIPLSKADLLVYAGLDLEIGWLPPLVQGSRNSRIQLGAKGDLDASTAIDVLDIPAGKVDRGGGDIHPRGNPHYWIPPVNALKVAKEIAARLKALDPGHAADYDEGLQKLGGVLKAKAAVWGDKAAHLRGLKVVAYHKSWTYV
jgi:zinc/manganese transport system substrate-binding protein